MKKEMLYLLRVDDTDNAVRLIRYYMKRLDCRLHLDGHHNFSYSVDNLVEFITQRFIHGNQDVIFKIVGNNNSECGVCTVSPGKFGKKLVRIYASLGDSDGNNSTFDNVIFTGEYKPILMAIRLIDCSQSGDEPRLNVEGFLGFSLKECSTYFDYSNDVIEFFQKHLKQWLRLPDDSLFQFNFSDFVESRFFVDEPMGVCELVLSPMNRYIIDNIV